MSQKKKVLYFKTNVSQRLILQNNAQYHLYIANTFLLCYFFLLLLYYYYFFVQQIFCKTKKSEKDVLEKCTCDPLITIGVMVGFLVRSTVESQASYKNVKFKQTKQGSPNCQHIYITTLFTLNSSPPHCPNLYTDILIYFIITL